MPTEKLSMRKIRELFKLRYEYGFTHRAIGQSLGVSPSTVSIYLSRGKQLGLSWPLPVELSDEQLYAQLFSATPSLNEPNRALPDLVHIHKELKRKGVTLYLLWFEYRNEHPNGYGYSRFCALYRE
jgi:transposase